MYITLLHKPVHVCNHRVHKAFSLKIGWSSIVSAMTFSLSTVWFLNLSPNKPSRCLFEWQLKRDAKETELSLLPAYSVPFCVQQFPVFWSKISHYFFFIYYLLGSQSSSSSINLFYLPFLAMEDDRGLKNFTMQTSICIPGISLKSIQRDEITIRQILIWLMNSPNVVNKDIDFHCQVMQTEDHY